MPVREQRVRGRASWNFFLIIIVACNLTSTGLAETYYVGTHGHDGNPGRTEAAAFQTIAHGVSVLEPGDTLIVCPGSYHEQVTIEKSGTPEKPIVIRSQYPHRAQLAGSVRVTGWTPAPGRPHTFRAPLTGSTSLVYEKDTDTEYLEVANLRSVGQDAGTFFYDADRKLLYVHPSDDLGMEHHVIDASVLDYGFVSPPEDLRDHVRRRVGVVIDGFVVTGYSLYGIYLRNADFCQVTNSIAHRNRTGILLYSAYRSRIANCEAFSNDNRCHQEMGNIAIMGYSMECELSNNVAHHTRQHGLRFYGGFYGNILRGNLAYDCAVGMQVKGEFYTAEAAKRYFQTATGAPRPQDLPMLFERNVAHQCTQFSLIPSACLTRQNTGVRALRGSGAMEQNIFVDENELPQTKFADPAYHDFRLQSDSRFRVAEPGKPTPGAFSYRDEVFFVSPTGDDSAEGTSVDAAWKSLGRAAARVKPGHTLYVLPGTYNDSVELKGLEATDAPTMLRAHGKGVVIIDGAGKLGCGLSVTNCSNVVIEGFRVRGTTTAAADVLDSTDIKLRDTQVYDNAGAGVSLNGRSVDVELTRNTLCFNGGEGLRVAATPESPRILSNIIRDNGTQIAVATQLPARAWSDYNNIGGRGQFAQVGESRIATMDEWRWTTGLDSQSIAEAPGFMDAPKRDFRLSPTSLCRGRGFLNQTMGAGVVAETAAKLYFANVRVVATSPTTSDLAWESRGRPTSIHVVYGTQAGKLNQSIIRDTGYNYATRHVLTLTGLEPGTPYFLKVGARLLLDGGSPFHQFNYAWPELGPKGEAERYESLKKQDTFQDDVLEFTTPKVMQYSEKAFHVRPDGSDDAAGSMDQPLQTIGRACELAQPGDRVNVHAGTYCESIAPLRSGVSGHPITFEAAKGERVVVSGKRLLIPTGADLRDRHHIIIRGFYFQEQDQRLSSNDAAGQVLIVGASNILVEQCVFDGRMQYCFAAHIYRSEDVSFRNNIVMNHHSAIIAADNRGTLEVSRNSFLGPTIHKLYSVRNERVVVRGNLVAENLFPKKELQFKIVVVGNTSVEMDYNCYYFDPGNKERRMVDFGTRNINPTTVTSLPDNTQLQRFAIKGDLDLWREKFGQDKHSIIADPKWKNPDLIERLRSRPRGWPDRQFSYPDFNREDLALQSDSPCLGKGENGGTIGADYAY